MNHVFEVDWWVNRSAKQWLKGITGALLVVLAASCAEYLPFSGGALQGQVVAAPATWDQVADIDIIQFETQPEEPYSVNLWVVEMDNLLYVHSGANRTDWVVHIEQDDRVRLGTNGSIFELTAERMVPEKAGDEDEFLRLAERYKAKYGNYPRNMNLGEIYLYRLSRR